MKAHESSAARVSAVPLERASDGRWSFTSWEGQERCQLITQTVAACVSDDLNGCGRTAVDREMHLSILHRVSLARVLHHGLPGALAARAHSQSVKWPRHHKQACMLSSYSFGQSTMPLPVVHKEIPSSATYALRHSVLWPNIPLSEQGLPEDDQPGVRHYGSYLDGDIVSVLTFLPPTEHREIQFRKFATAHACQSRGIGSSLLRYAMDQVLAGERGEVLIWCNARTTALAFYERFGLKPLLPEGAKGRGYTKYGEGGKAIDYVRIGGFFDGRCSS